MVAADVIAGITAALAVGSVNPDVVAVEARKTVQQRGAERNTPQPVSASGEQVVSLTERRLAELPSDPRPLPSVSQYDELLDRETS